ncbi:MAG TPA: hypothetical protein VFJ58_25845 [Armatimonadota bacterium]|nr:hypothetical protein [Armatimonadota bacterium]
MTVEEQKLMDPQETLRRFRLAVRDAMLDHKRTGHPVAAWKNGKVVWIPPDEIVPQELDEHGNILPK